MEENLSGIDLLELHAQTEEALTRTKDLYVDLLAWFAKKKIGASIQDLKHHDMAFLAQAKEFDEDW